MVQDRLVPQMLRLALPLILPLLAIGTLITTAALTVVF
jgi:hypothetical protein